MLQLSCDQQVSRITSVVQLYNKALGLVTERMRSHAPAVMPWQSRISSYALATTHQQSRTSSQALVQPRTSIRMNYS